MASDSTGAAMAFDFDAAWEAYHRELNGRWPWPLFRRLAFTRWRPAVLWLASRKGWMRETWRERLLDALYPDDCLVTFQEARR